MSGDLFDPEHLASLQGRQDGFSAQEAEVLAYLESSPDASLTNLEAALKLGVGRLASRVSAMQKKGIKFRKVPETTEKAAGRGHARIIRYYLDRTVAS